VWALGPDAHQPGLKPEWRRARRGRALHRRRPPEGRAARPGEPHGDRFPGVCGGPTAAASDRHTSTAAIESSPQHKLPQSPLSTPGEPRPGTKVPGGGARLFTTRNPSDITPKIVQTAPISDTTWEVKIDNIGSARSWGYSLQLTCVTEG
jgi:hypothetical protein